MRASRHVESGPVSGNTESGKELIGLQRVSTPMDTGTDSLGLGGIVGDELFDNEHPDKVVGVKRSVDGDARVTKGENLGSVRFVLKCASATDLIDLGLVEQGRGGEGVRVLNRGHDLAHGLVGESVPRQHRRRTLGKTHSRTAEMMVTSSSFSVSSPMSIQSVS